VSRANAGVFAARPGSRHVGCSVRTDYVDISRGVNYMASPENLDDLLRDDLRDLLDGETQITKALPKMAKAAESQQLRTAFEQHLRQTQEHIERLNRAFEALDEKPRRKTCKGIKGLIEEGQEMMSELDRGAVLDAALIAAGQKVEHYEIAAYGTLRTYANLLGHDELVSLFETTLGEEKSTDQKLTGIAESLVNPEAAEGEDEEEEQPRGRNMADAMRGRRGGASTGVSQAAARPSRGSSRGAGRSSRKK
jgi:ferritin-like metal-binding protein YciE